MKTHVNKPYFRRRKSRLQKSASTALVIALLYAIVFSQLDWMVPRSKAHPWLEPTLPWSALTDDMSLTLVLNSLTVYVLVVLVLGILPEMLGHKKQRIGPPAHTSIPVLPPPSPKQSADTQVSGSPGNLTAENETSLAPNEGAEKRTAHTARAA